MSIDIITFGSATKDIFLKSKKFRVVGEKKFITGQGLCWSLGSKIDVEDMLFSIGGGGTNTAATFANQGFKTAFCGMVGQDQAGREVLKELGGLGITAALVKKNNRKITNHSIILSASGKKERTILAYRGAAGELSKKDIPWAELKAKWFYLAPLSGKSALTSEALVDFAGKNKIKVALNPGNSQLALPQKQLERILAKINILLLNREEASLLTKIPYQKEAEIFKKLDKLVPGVCVMTKGMEGAVVSDGQYLYKAKAMNLEPVDWTGAGDSFGSGFVSGFIQSKGDIEYGIRLGAANSAACLKKIGAKEGLLKKGEKWPQVKVEKELCALNNRCSVK